MEEKADDCKELKLAQLVGTHGDIFGLFFFFLKNGLKLKFAVQGDYSGPLDNQG